jgi:hypothetical protein
MAASDEGILKKTGAACAGFACLQKVFPLKISYTKRRQLLFL